MEKHILTGLRGKLNAEGILNTLPAGFSRGEILDTARAMSESALKIADPKAVVRVAAVERTGADCAVVNGVRLEGTLVGEKLKGHRRAFPYVATCGIELHEWARSRSDPLESYIAECLTVYFLRCAQKGLYAFMRKTYVPTGYMPALNPGSLSRWPLTQQRALFDILGNVEKDIGVTLSGAFLMTPFKTISGLFYEDTEKFENCMLCPIVNCPDRRAAFK